MQLQGQEIDEIDVFSWGCGLKLPDRPQRQTIIDDFGGFAPWLNAMRCGERGAWKDALPFSVTPSREAPSLLQALDLLRQYAMATSNIEAWLALPIFIHRLHISPVPLPNLVAGTKAFRFGRPPPVETLRATLKSLTTSASDGLTALEAMESAYHRSLRAIRTEYRPGKLSALLALSLSAAILSPATVAEHLDLSVAGAGKLLARAAALNLIVEVSGRQSWKTYMSPDLAVSFGFRKPSLGRPRKDLAVLSTDDGLALVLSDFDREMAEIDARLAGLS